MARPLIALLTDFGLRDHYVGTMKGVALGICPDVTLRRHLARRPGARRPGRRAGARRSRTATSRPARFFSSSSIRASGPRGAGSPSKRATIASSVRTTACSRWCSTGRAGPERGRADRSPLRAADDQPDVRGARPFRAGGGVAGARHCADGARAARRAAGRLGCARGTGRRRRRSSRRGAARRSFRQSHYEHRPGAARPVPPPRVRRARRPDRQPRRVDLCRRRARRAVRAGRQLGSSRDRDERRQRGGIARSADAAPPVRVAADCVIAISRLI